MRHILRQAVQVACPQPPSPMSACEACGLHKFSACSADPRRRPGSGVPVSKSGAPLSVRHRHIVRQAAQVACPQPPSPLSHQRFVACRSSQPAPQAPTEGPVPVCVFNPLPRMAPIPLRASTYLLSVYFRTHVLLADNFADKRARLVSRHSFVGTLRLVDGYCEPGSTSHSDSRQ